MSSLSLRPWQMTDAASLAAAYRGSPDLERQLDPDAGTAAGARRIISADLGWDPQHACNLAVIAGGVAVGNVGISAIDFRHGTAWTYYWLAGPVRGKGLAARAAAALANWALTDLQLHRLELVTGRTIRRRAEWRAPPASGRKASNAQNCATEPSASTWKPTPG